MFRHRIDVGTMLRVFELNVKNPSFAQHKNITNAKGFSLKNLKKKPDNGIIVIFFMKLENCICIKACVWMLLLRFVNCNVLMHSF